MKLRFPGFYVIYIYTTAVNMYTFMIMWDRNYDRSSVRYRSCKMLTVEWSSDKATRKEHYLVKLYVYEVFTFERVDAFLLPKLSDQIKNIKQKTKGRESLKLYSVLRACNN